ncbi:ATP-binding protein [Ornithinimicrobium sediminis]|uniref:ATP-binding protein n=1 Tax=Ornithinimicrobium sediminis TaxID=2904603 RepID=UPI001E5A001C|nr:helix-turn-helix transcriptional regulator [Ornithinimicrobium sediminis]MCE0485877.1 AAA family ATPase [Ornithinimicrobium sediminis]
MDELYERDSTLRALGEAFARASRGDGSVALVAGEAGMGKSAVVDRFARDLDSAVRVLVGLCDDLAIPRPLGAFQDVADHLPEPLAHVIRSGTDRRDLHALLLQELRCSRIPTVLVLEDVHWADEATLDVITVLGRRASELPLLLLLTYRTGETGPGHQLHAAIDAMQRTTSVHVELEPLSVASVARMAGEEAERIYALAGGNPFFVSEMVAHEDGPLPPSVANAVLGRVARLDRASREAVELISVVPTRVSTRLLDLVEPGWASATAQAERRHLLTSDPAHVRFRHALVRAAVRSSVPPSRRRVLHRRVLCALQEVGADPAELVHHAEAAGDLDVVAEHALVAARQARGARSHREAFAHFSRAAAFADRLDQQGRARLWEDLADAAYLVGRTDEAQHAVGCAVAAYREAGQMADAARCLGTRAHVHWVAGDGALARRDARTAVRMLGRDAPDLERARCWLQLAELATLAGRTTEGMRWGERALRLAGTQPEIRARTLVVLGTLRMQVDPDDVEPLSQAMAYCRTQHLHHHMLLARTGFAFVNLHWVRPQEALRHAERGRSEARAHQIDTLARYLDGICAWLQLRAGRREDAERMARQVLDSAGPAQETVAHLQARTVLAELAVRRGDPDADDVLDALVVAADRTGELQRILPVLELQVEHALTLGRPLPVERFARVQQIVGAEPLRHGGLGGRFAAWARLCGVPPTVAGTAPPPHAAMLTGDWRTAARRFEAAGWVHDQALMLSLEGSPDALLEACTLARSVGAGPLERWVCRRLHEIGVPAPRGPLASTRSNPAQLTDRQLEVLTLVGSGKGNTAIAEELHISPRTVEHHVSTILTKLGARTRAEAVARCAELDLL